MRRDAAGPRRSATKAIRQSLVLLLVGVVTGLGIGATLWLHAALADAPLQLCAKGNGQVYSTASSCPADAPTALAPVAAQADLAALESTVSTLQSKLAADEKTISALQSTQAAMSLSSDGSTLTIAGTGANSSSKLKTVLSLA